MPKIYDVEFPEQLLGDGSLQATRMLADLVHRSRRDFMAMTSWLPEKIDAVLDIGCGLALIDVEIARHHPGVRINLLDGSETTDRHVKFEQTTVPWSDVMRGVSIVNANCDASAIGIYHPTAEGPIPSELILSFKSWGHHYPVATYVDLVKRSLRPGGRIVLDIRHGTDGKESMEASGFSAVGKINETTKCSRWVFR